MTLASADDSFKQFGPGSGRTFKVMTCYMYFNFVLNLYMTFSSANNSFKQFGPRSDQTSKAMTS